MGLMPGPGRWPGLVADSPCRALMFPSFPVLSSPHSEIPIMFWIPFVVGAAGSYVGGKLVDKLLDD